LPSWPSRAPWSRSWTSSARPDREVAAAIVDEHAADAPEVLRQDFYNSLLAAYTVEEVREQIAASGLKGLELSEPTNRHWLVQGRIRAR
jgi:hypothetical protein